MSKIKIAVSSCLLGEKVRFDGGHKLDKWITQTLKGHVEIVPICPELFMGMTVPRETIHIEYENDGDVVLVGTKSKKDYTQVAKEKFKELVENLKKEGVSGVILQKNSPSCGIERVKYYNKANAIPDKRGDGLFTALLKENISDLPIICSGRLQNEDLKHLFLLKLYAHKALEKVESASGFQDFHRSYKYLIMENMPHDLKPLGQIVADSNKENLDNNILKYKDIFFSYFNDLPKKGRELNTLTHMFGYFKNNTVGTEKEYIENLYQKFSSGITSKESVVELLQYFIHTHKENYLSEQKYFNPYPITLKTAS